MWWRKPPPPPTPWYKKLWAKGQMVVASVATVFSLLAGGYGYIKLDTTNFIKTTEVIAVADVSNVYVQIDTLTQLKEMTYLIFTLDGQQVRSLVYPQGLPQGKHTIELPLPFTSSDRYVDVEVDIVFVGLKTLFQPQTLSVKLDVEKQGVNDDKNTNSSDGFYVEPRIFYI